MSKRALWPGLPLSMLAPLKVGPQIRIQLIGEPVGTRSYTSISPPLLQTLYYGRQTKPGDPVPGPQEGVCLCFREERLENVAAGTARFADYAAGLGSSKAVASTTFFSFLLDREDGAVMALLKDRQVNLSEGRGAGRLGFGPSQPIKVLFNEV